MIIEAVLIFAHAFDWNWPPNAVIIKSQYCGYMAHTALYSLQMPGETVWLRQVMFQDSTNFLEGSPGLRTGVLQHPRWILTAFAWIVTAGIGINGAFAFSNLKIQINSSDVEQGGLAWTIAETSASNQENKKAGNQSDPDDDPGTLCVKRMDACYEACKPGEAQPGACNLDCTTDKICGMPVRMSYGQFLDFQVEMLAANTNIFSKATQHPQDANSSPARSVVLPEPKRRPHQNRLPGAQARPASGRPGAAPAETGAAGNSGWPHLSLPQLSWPRF
jgi:hypothetical protein